MKNSIKKMIRHTLFGSAAIMGLLMIGTGSASAGYNDPHELEIHFYAPFKDINGNAVQLNREYYMEPVDFPGQGLEYAQWSTSDWAKLTSNNRMAVKFENERYGINGMNSLVKIKTDKTKDIITDDEFWGPLIDRNVPMYLGAGFNAEGVELHSLMTNQRHQYWIPMQSSIPELASTNYIAFKNQEKDRYLAYRNSGQWLYVDQSTINSKTKWRLIPKQ